MEAQKQKQLSLQFRSVSHRILRFFESKPGKNLIKSLTGNNCWIIGYLSENKGKDIFQKDIEKEFDITRSTASKVLDLMEQKGFVERQRVAHDARLKKIVLTEKADTISKIMQDDMIDLEKVVTHGFTQAELETFFGYIERVKQNLENATVTDKEDNK